MSYELRFEEPLTELSFIRTTVPSHTSLPPWSAYAYNASNALLSSIVEPPRYPGPPAATFRLAGPGITLFCSALRRARACRFGGSALNFCSTRYSSWTGRKRPCW
jgi:hypothetical protein